MGIIAESIVTYAQPLLDGTDGSAKATQRALSLAQVCWNLALLPEKECDVEIGELQSSFQMDDRDFEDFRRSLLMPMIQRHHEMFPNMPRFRNKRNSSAPSTPQSLPAAALPAEKYPGTGRNAPCPCNSGRKYKRCCGQ